MKKFIYMSGTIVLAVFAVFCINLTAGKDGGLSASGPGTEINIPTAIQNGNDDENYTESGFSPRSGGWQLQVMPNMGIRLVRDLYFTDSLTGYAVASPDSYTDSAHILKTTNGGNTWQIKLTKAGRIKRIIFINSQTGFAGGTYLQKTTNAGENWVVWNWPLDRVIYDMQIFGEDTIWYGDSDPISGGVIRTTNGGLNWEKRDNGIPANSYPDRIYFYNSRIGFAY
ncbi:MAG: hypothetical protein L0Y76_06210, partial [Ignavibacteria bacterium]|nr:hypothetical protein [Ignavibacteria bacterium]